MTKFRALLFSAVFATGATAALADITVSTLITTPLVIEGLTNDAQGNLYAPGRTPGAGLPCPVWRVPIPRAPPPPLSPASAPAAPAPRPSLPPPRPPPRHAPAH